MKEINEEQLLLLAYFEGELTGAEKEKAEALIASDGALQREYNLLAGTRLEPDTTLVYKNKQALKRPQAKPERVSLSYIIWPATIAACFAWFIMSYVPKTGSANIGSTVAMKTEEKKNTDITLPAAKNEAREIPAQAEKEMAVQLENTRVVKVVKKEGESTAQPADDGVMKQQYKMPGMLVAKEYTAGRIVAPEPEPLKLAEVEVPGFNSDRIIQSGRDKWLAKVEKTADKLIGYLQKPDVSLDKVKAEGKNYWEITLQSEAYEVQGRLYTKR